MNEKIIILDFGAQVTQPLAKRVRELNTYCEIVPYNKFPVNTEGVKGIIIAEGTSTTNQQEVFQPVFELFKEKIPWLNISVADADALNNFIKNTCGCKQDWTPATFVETTVNEMKTLLENDRVVLGLSGGVDSTVTAVLLNKAIGQNLFCIFVDHGLLRKNEFETVLENYKALGLNVIGVRAANRFYEALKGISDPETKRKIIGKSFIDVFEEEAQKLQNIKWLAQGTIYPDIIESLSVTGKIIKSHHNVGGLPEKMNLKLLEPLMLLFKDEVRKVGKALNIPDSFTQRHPFPGPGLGVRILGNITPEKVRILQDADNIFVSGLIEHNLYDKVWQAGAILLPVQSVGVQGDERTYENAIALRAVLSTDAMTADWAKLPYEFLSKISNEIIYQVQGVNRVVYDISAKPPATIEWE